MSQPTPRLRVFAGPNGSGKSTIKDSLLPQWLGVYVNADDIEKAIRTQGFLEFAEFGCTVDDLAGLPAFMANSSLLHLADLLDAAARLLVKGTRLHFGAEPVNAYFASVLSDFIRHHLLRTGKSFTFETVMSSPDKVDFMRRARVRNRVLNGGPPRPGRQDHQPLPPLAGVAAGSRRAIQPCVCVRQLEPCADVDRGHHGRRRHGVADRPDAELVQVSALGPVRRRR